MTRPTSMKLTSFIVVTLVFVIQLTAQQTNKPASRTAPEVSTESYAVYSALVTQRYSHWFFKGGAPVIISSFTKLSMKSHEPVEASCRSRLEGKPSDLDLLNKLILINATKHRIEPKLSLPGSYSLLTGKTQVRNGEEPGVVWMSAVAFSTDGQHAMVWTSNYCGALCATGLLWKLDKRANKWSVTSQQAVCGFIS